VHCSPHRLSPLGVTAYPSAYYMLYEYTYYML